MSNVRNLFDSTRGDTIDNLSTSIINVCKPFRGIDNFFLIPKLASDPDEHTIDLELEQFVRMKSLSAPTQALIRAELKRVLEKVG